MHMLWEQDQWLEKYVRNKNKKEEKPLEKESKIKGE